MKNFKKEIILSLLVVFVFCLIALGSGEDDTPKKVETSSSSETKDDLQSSDNEVDTEAEDDLQSSDNEIDIDKKFIVGEVVELYDNQVQVTDVRKSDGSDWDKPKDGQEFIIVTVAIKNSGSSNINYNTYNFEMKNSMGQITDTAFAIIDSDTSLSSGELVPGGFVIGTIVFEQPKNDTALELLFEPSFWSDTKITFDIMNKLESFEILQGDTIQSTGTEYGINESAELGDARVTVTDVKKSQGSDWDQPKEGQEFIIVTVEINNIGDSELTYNPFDFKMGNSNGQIIDGGFITIDSDTSLSSGELASGGSISGTIAFEQPIDDPALTLIYEENSFISDKKLIFDLNK